MSQDLKNLVDHYTDASEQTRLTSPWGLLELQRTQALLKQYLPPAPATILDVGGGAGVYSLWLAEQGYTVHLIDPVPKHVEQAHAASSQAKSPIASALVGDARKLAHADDRFDAVLLLGPLYHLLDRGDRIAALNEAYRVLKPSGPLFAAGISRFASALDGLSRKLLDDPDFVPIMRRDLQEGQHRNPTSNPEYFTDTFFHLPAELEAEVEEAGFVSETVSGVEGPAWILSDLPDWMNQPKRHELLMEILGQIAHHESLLGASAHIIAVGRKPSSQNGVSIRLKHCELRNWRTDDTASLIEHANDKEIARYLRDLFPHPYTMADAVWWIKFANSKTPVTNLAIVVDGQAVGGIGLTLQSDVLSKSAELGYWLGQKFWGRGIVSEAVAAMTEYGFETFDICRIFAEVFEGNEGSAKVLEKCGFKHEGRLSKAIFKNGKLLDKLVYALVHD